MPSACSDPAQRLTRPRLVIAVLASLLGLSQLPKPLEASPRMAWGRASFPVASFVGYTSPFGLRVHPVSGGLRPHAGLDIAAPLGSAVRNWWGGTLMATISDAGCGNGLLIRSGAYEHLYCHLAGRIDGDNYRSGAVFLRRGQRVRTGQTIGHVGLTGNTTGPHLHWGLRYRDRWLDPAAVLRAMAAERRLRQPTGRGAFNVGQTR
jgi:murein DD-endopeptidase MepM/ murein hydrolase activator NlpD